MGAHGKVLIHFNGRLSHQVQFAQALRYGFRRHNIAAQSTTDIRKDADIHVVLGPWYAKSAWKNHARCLFLDRCHVGDPNMVVSLGWMRNGAQTHANGVSRRFTRHYEINITPWSMRPIKRVLLLCDYGYKPDVEISDVELVIRKHPSVEIPRENLADALQNADYAVGHSTSALIQAVLAGVPITCTDKQSISYMVSGSINAPYRQDRQRFINTLSWANWHHDEIASGAAWEHLKQYVDSDNHPTIG
jgi:hypothetical protein